MSLPEPVSTSPQKPSAAPIRQLVRESCILCNATVAPVLVEHPEMTWVHCTCGLVYKRDEIAANDPATGYDEGYLQFYDSRLPHRVKKSRTQILDLMNAVGPGDLLDIGCSGGYTLRAATELGLPAKGADINPLAVDRCRELGFRAEVGTLTDLPFDAQSFRMIVMKHVLEHVPDPRAVCAELRRVVEPGGGLFIAVPNMTYHKAQNQPKTYRFFAADRGGRNHYVYYEPATLSRLLAEEGFRTVSVHPQLFHRHASVGARLGELLLSPYRAAKASIFARFSLHNEFWLVAVRDDSVRG